MEDFVRWVRAARAKNLQCCMTETPPNRIFDLEDGTFTLSVFTKKEDAEAFKQDWKRLRNTPFAFRIRFQGRFRNVFRFMRDLEPWEKRNCAVALFLEATDELLANFPEWRRLEQHMKMCETPDNPFYQGVAQAILTRLTESGYLC